MWTFSFYDFHSMIFFRSSNFLVDAIYSTFFSVWLTFLPYIYFTNSLDVFGKWACVGQKVGNSDQNGRLSALMCVITEKPCHYHSLCEQNLRFRGGICREKYQLDHIQNGGLAAIIDFDMRSIWKTVSDN